ncbi:hypothetical protein AOLI_G00300820 [Acnodon oligacanthus]
MRLKPETPSDAESAATGSCTRRGRRDWLCSTPDELQDGFPFQTKTRQIKVLLFFFSLHLRRSCKYVCAG